MTNQGLSYKEKLISLRAAMAAQGVDGFIVPRADEYQGEFLAAYAERLPWLTGFTGSAGVAVVLKGKAIVLTDARYIIQVKQQIDAALYDTGDTAEITAAKWLASECSDGDVIGYDPLLHTPKQIESIEEALDGMGARLRPVSNLVDEIWESQPHEPGSAVQIFPESIAGVSSEEKRKAIGRILAKKDLHAAALSMPDSICWLLNIRGQDVDYIPLVLSYALIDQKGDVQWFVDERRISGEVRKHMGAGVETGYPEDISEHIESLAGQNIGVDYSRSPIWFKAALEEAGAKVSNLKDPCILPKSLKSKAEQTAIKDAHIRDGAALVKFLCWLDTEAPKGALTELDMDKKLQDCRSEYAQYCGPSFPTIAGFGSNGAIVHYRATKENNAPINPPGFLLVDSGGQYPGGTTDITRTIVIESVTDEARDNFTRVLKGHIAVASAEVPKGTLGADIDALARGPLQEAGLDYAHGTGHGVGCYLAVHEAAANFSPKGKEEVRAGMLISNEPGYYKEGAYGIRIENLVLVKSVGADRLGFETVSLAPIDRRAINKDMLGAQEIQWLDEYHQSIREKLSPLLDEVTKGWLREQTRALN